MNAWLFGLICFAGVAIALGVLFAFLVTFVRVVEDRYQDIFDVFDGDEG